METSFTILIPTRERCDTLYSTLRTCIAQKCEDLEIVVSDNFSQDNTKNVVSSFNDNRIKYINTGTRVSMSENWEFALDHITKDWVTILGDDDGLLPSTLNKVAQVIEETNADAIRSKVCSYAWPSLLDKEFGRLQVPLTSGYEIRNAKMWLSKAIKYQTKYPELPMLYNGGFVKHSVIQNIKKKTGLFYKSCAPDVYSSIAIASAIDQYVYSNEPLAINGASIHSTGTSSFSSSEPNQRVKSPSKMFSSENNIPFHSDIPMCADGSYPPSIEATIYESYLQSDPLRDGNQDKIYHIQRMLELSLANGRKIHQETLKDWAKLTAKFHELDFTRIQNRAKIRKLYLELHKFRNKIYSGLNMYRAGSNNLFLKDVYEASLVAQNIIQTKPNIFSSILSLVR